VFKKINMAKTIYDIEAGIYVNSLAEKLKKMEEFKMPDWARFVKTSTARERPPAGEWWHLRVASVLRQIYLNGVMGVSKLRTRYGGKKNRGVAPNRFYKGSGKIIRVIFQQGEKAGFLEKIKEKKSGRKLTKKGKEFLDEAAN
jgi:small subunit ribosomal protein S19e